MRIKDWLVVINRSASETPNGVEVQLTLMVERDMLVHIAAMALGRGFRAREGSDLMQWCMDFCQTAIRTHDANDEGFIDNVFEADKLIEKFFPKLKSAEVVLK